MQPYNKFKKKIFFRTGTIKVLKSLQLESYVDFVMCGDDRDSLPKPHPHNALKICQILGVEPKVKNLFFLFLNFF